MPMSPATMVAAYIRLRDFKKNAEEEFKQSLTKTNQAMELLESRLLEHLNTNGVNSLACDDGTVYKNTQTSATVENREAFLDYVRQNSVWEALDVKANKTFVVDYMELNGVALPGLKVTQMAKVGIRRS